MKIIVSHDIDHWYRDDHWFKDLYFPKFGIRSTLNFLKGNISFATLMNQFSVIKSNRMERLNEVLQFDREHGIAPSCFVGFANGLNLSYSSETAFRISQELSLMRVDYYPHGIAYENFKLMKAEQGLYLKTKSDHVSYPMGIRMHYLRKSNKTNLLLKRLGYAFASNDYYGDDFKDPFWQDGILEFPVSMMDSYEIAYNLNDPSASIKKSINRIKLAERQGLGYFTLIFHDHHFSDTFSPFRDWYRAVIEYLKEHYEFTTFKEAYHTLKSDNKYNNTR